MTKAETPSTSGLDRRALMQALTLGAVAAGAAAGPVQAQVDHHLPASSLLPGPKPKVAMLVYPRMVLMDLVGPQTVLNIAQCEIHLVGKSKGPCATDVGVPVFADTTFDECPKDLDVLFVPGGILGTTDCMNDPETLAFLADRGERAKYVTSVCTGGLVLGAAGLLRGYKAATHWAVMDLLPILGAQPVHERVVVDRNRITGGGVTAGIDYGLTIAAKLRGEETAKRVQLIIEYAPNPPFHAGSPEGAGPELLAKVKAGRVGMDANARKAAEAAAARFQT